MKFNELIEPIDRAIEVASTAQCIELVGELERLKALANLRMLSEQIAPHIPVAAEPTVYLTVEEVAARFHVAQRWLYRHKNQMPHSQPSRKVLLFPEQAITKWFASRKG